jgi:starch phosphorylase
MAALAIKTASFINGVSQLHGEVSRVMFQGLWENLPLVEVPITAITNGVHARSVVAKPNQELYDRYLGPSWSEKGAEDPLWDRVGSIPDEELWRNHERCRSEMVVYVREHLQKHLRDRGASPAEIAHAQEVLDPGVLTIGFARRFATYKRANLFMRDIERIKKIMRGNKDRQLQFVIAGKAHPKDMPGKDLIRQIIHQIREAGIGDQVVFVPDYDIYLARFMVAGCDIWLNTPRRPREASGTSGMKASMNGLPNVSILDGWWDEADYVRTGWPIGHGETYDDPDYEDEVEANALYDLLEKEVVPLFYNRDTEEIPRGWVAKMKDAIKLNTPYFNTARMLRDYSVRGYFPASDRYFTMTTNAYTPAKELASWKRRLFERWYDIKIEDVDITAPPELMVNQAVAVKTRINLAGLTADDVQVELYQGSVNADGQIINGLPTVMNYQGTDEHHHSVYTADIIYSSSGLQGLSLRVLPKHENLSSLYEPGLVLWA